VPDNKYGWRHQQLRERMRRQVEAGLAVCARCGKPIIPGTPWDAGHVDGNPNLYQGAEHRACNRASASHRAARRRYSFDWDGLGDPAAPRRQSRDW
jgi:hypothetical protein